MRVFFFINPNGIVFGPDVSLDIDGSFYAATAGYLNLGENGRFDALQPENTVLTAAPPEAFGFLQSPRTIDVQGQISGKPGSTLSLIGGDITITGHVNVLDGGDLHLSSLGSQGETDLIGVPADTLDTSGNITLENGSSVLSSGDQAASIHIRAGNLVMENALVGMYNTGNDGDGVLEVHASDTVTMTDGELKTYSTKDGKGGNIRIEAGDLVLDQDAEIAVNAYGPRCLR